LATSIIELYLLVAVENGNERRNVCVGARQKVKMQRLLAKTTTATAGAMQVSGLNFDTCDFLAGISSVGGGDAGTEGEGWI
jgi:hypothetical protein